MDKKFTVCISFKNEGDEVRKTIQSVVDTASNNVDIIVYNDASDDNYNYKDDLKDFDIQYYEGTERLGSSGGKEFCIQKATTPYILLLDAHSRIYTKNWLEIAIDIMDKPESKNTLFCCVCQYFNDDTDHMDNTKHTKGYGGHFTYSLENILRCSWNIKNLTKDGDYAFNIPCIVGANYIFNKEYWNYVKGFQGLRLYGREEEYISYKYLLTGGKVKCLTKLHTGHKSRLNGVPYVSYISESMYNELVIAYVCIPEKFNKLLKLWEHVHYKNKASLIKAINVFKKNKEELDILQKYIKNIKVLSFNEVDNVNSIFQELIKYDKKKNIENNKKIYKKFNNTEIITEIQEIMI